MKEAVLQFLSSRWSFLVAAGFCKVYVCCSITAYWLGVCHSLAWLQNTHSIEVLGNFRFRSISMLVTNFGFMVDVRSLIFMDYMGMLSVAHNLKHGYVRWFLNEYWNGSGRNLSWADFRYYHSIFLEGLGRKLKTIVRIVTIKLRFKQITSWIQVRNVTACVNLFWRAQQ